MSDNLREPQYFSSVPQPQAETYAPEMDCPRCGRPMVKRTGRYGGFWGCTSYPRCRGTRRRESAGRGARGRSRDRVPASARSASPAMDRAPTPSGTADVTAVPYPVRSAPNRGIGNSWKWVAGFSVVFVVVYGLVSGQVSRSPTPTSPSPNFRYATLAPPNSMDESGGAWGAQYNGYPVVCADGWISHSGGIQGACSHHGGIGDYARTLELPSSSSPTQWGGVAGPRYNGYSIVCADGWISHSGGRQGACSRHGGVGP